MNDDVYSIKCRHCGAKPKQFCHTANRRIRLTGDGEFYIHFRRILDYKAVRLSQSRQIRKEYLRDWLQMYGNIFREN